MSAPLRAALVGGGVGLALAGAGIVQGLVSALGSALFPLEPNMKPGALDAALSAHRWIISTGGGIIAAGLVLVFVLSPLWKETRMDRRIGLGAAAAALLIAFVMQGPAMLLGGLALAGLFAVGTSREIAPDSGTGDRLAVIMAAIGAMVVTAFVPSFAFSLLFPSIRVMAIPAVGFIGVLVLARPMLWVLLRASAQAARRPVGGAAPPVGGGPATANVPVPRGWMWGYLHYRAMNLRAFGFLYVDAMAGPSFHVVADLAAPFDLQAIHAAGYRGARTVRLPGYETLYPVAGTEELQRQAFEEGSATGAVVLALSPAQMGQMALPPMPSWAYIYLRAA